MICGGQSIRQVILTAKTVAAVLRLPVDRIACNADGICLLLDKRSVVSSHSKKRGYGLCRLHGTAETAVLPMIIEHERLVSVLLRPQGAGYIFRAIHHAATLVVEAPAEKDAANVCCFIPGCAPSAPAKSCRSRTSSR